MQPLPIHSSGSWLWNGTSFIEGAGLPVSDRGVRYGMSLFESIAIRGGRPEFLMDHLGRLETSCHRVNWVVASEALEEVRRVLSNLGGESYFARVYHTAGDGGLFDPVTEPRVFLFIEERNGHLSPAYRVESIGKPHAPLFDGFKTANYWAHIHALEEAKHKGADEGLLFDGSGELISACMANVFVVIDGEILTPPGAVGARRGTVREWVIENIAVTGSPIFRSDLERVEECFITNAWVGVMPVSHLNSHPLATTIGENLRKRFFDNL